MTRQPEGRRGQRVPSARHPLRTCVGCRRVLPQGTLLRIARTPDGLLEPDPGRRGGGRGTYLCFREVCLTEAIRRGRWVQAFRVPTVAGPETIARLRALLDERAAVETRRDDR